MNEIEMSPDDGLQREQDEHMLWEQHEKDLKELEKLLGEGAVISKRFDCIFGNLQTGTFFKQGKHKTRT